MKKRTKNEGQNRRFYASGIPMQLVNAILVKTAFNPVAVKVALRARGLTI